MGGRFPDFGYLILYRDMVEVHFSHDPNHVPADSSHAAYVRVEDAKALSDEWAILGLNGEGIPRFFPAENEPWGVCELHIIDIDGNLLRLGNNL